MKHCTLFSRSVVSVRKLILVGICLVSSDLAHAQSPIRSAEARQSGYEMHGQMQLNSPFGLPEWQFVGPTNISGRMTDIAVVTPKGKNYTIYVAGASGGVWKTENEGTSWVPVFESGGSTSIGDVTIAPSNPDIVWIGTG